MGLRAAAKTGARLQGMLKLARLLEAPESELAEAVKRAESTPLFQRLLAERVVRVDPFPEARFSARRFGGWGLRTSSEGLPQLLDGRDELLELMRRIGQEDFEACFLKGEGLTDAERARRCGISVADCVRVRDFLDKVYVQEELEGPAAPAPARTFSAVAGIALEDGKPVLGFFNRDIWKGRYAVDETRLSELLRRVPPGDARRLEALLKRLSFFDRRKSTLYRVLEEVVAAQAAYFASGDPGARRPFSQKELAGLVESDPSVINRLVAEKSVQLPWGVEAPLKALLPSAKTLLRDRLYDLAAARPELSDEELRRALAEKHGALLSRRSITQYRAELGLGGRGRRALKPTASAPAPAPRRRK